MTMTNEEMNQTDSLIQRNRLLRWITALLSPILAVILGRYIGSYLAGLLNFPAFIGTIPGTSLGMGFGAWIFLNKSFIRNPAVTAFVTVNPVAGWMGLDPLVCYGPGTYPCFFWEQRDGANIFSLGEVSHRFDMTMQCIDGTITVKYEVRLRADITKYQKFITGVASVGAGIKSLIEEAIIRYLSGKSIRDVLKDLKGLNDMLANEFAHGQGRVLPLEDRLGVIIGDITVGELLPSEEVQNTMSALTESSVIDQIVAQSFGYDDAKKMRAAINKGTISADEASRRRTQTMALSGNLQGMDLSDKRLNFHVSGLGAGEIAPEVLAALAAIVPAAKPYVEAFANKPAAKAAAKPKTRSKSV